MNEISPQKEKSLKWEYLKSSVWWKIDVEVF